jgi:NTE family protein
MLSRALSTPAALAFVLVLGLVQPAVAQPQAQAERPTPSPAGAAGAPRPKVGLVLGGGGARGAAHIGVLEVLERLRIPVDCVAGTSMGALIAGSWGAGLSTAQMREELARADWSDIFVDNPDHDDLNFRNKRLYERFLPGSETGFKDGGVVTLPGVVAGQKIKLFFNQLVRANTGEPEIQKLPLAVSIIATDIGTGERVVFRDGSLTQAMRASMSVPGLMAPLQYRARKLVDGGLVDNVPVREVRDRCGAEVVIAVNVGSPPLKPDEVSGLLSITTQMVALLTEQNVAASLATLKPQDIYIQPDLGPITAADFQLHDQAAERGRIATEALAQRLMPLAVSEADYALWREKVAVREREVPRIDEIKIEGMLRADPAVVQRYVEQRLGEPLDSAQLDRDLLRTYGDGYYERVDYSVYTTQRGRNVLTILPVEKTWGPDYIRLGIRFEGNLSQGSNFLLRGAYHKTWLNDLGGELLTTGELGSVTSLSTEWYQPLTRQQGLFVSATAEHRRERTDYFYIEQRIAEYRSARSRLDLMAGYNIDLLGQVRLGWRAWSVNHKLETGIDIFSSLRDHSGGGWLLAADMDRLDRLYFPRRGWAAQASWFKSPSKDYSRVSLEARGAMPMLDWVLAGRATWTGSPSGNLPLHDAGRLGGFLNLTAFSSGQLLGDEVGYAHVRAERIIGRLPAGLRGDMRLGVAIEAGKVAQPYTVQRRNGWLHSVAVYLGGETPLGPVYLGMGRGSDGLTNAYLFIGTP